MDQNATAHIVLSPDPAVTKTWAREDCSVRRSDLLSVYLVPGARTSMSAQLARLEVAGGSRNDWTGARTEMSVRPAARTDPEPGQVPGNNQSTNLPDRLCLTVCCLVSHYGTGSLLPSQSSQLGVDGARNLFFKSIYSSNTIIKRL